ncbi:MAG: transcription-repair coupling factor [Candidatus Hydrogenedentes bacterium]|nr:transcription-repair coupling factor [Candidatus Hydrogenedentota bacterium]
MALIDSLPRLDFAANVVRHLKGKAGREVELVGPWGSGKTLAALQASEGKPLLILAPGRTEAEGIFEDLLTFDDPGRCALFPAWEVLPTDQMAPADDVVAERMNTLKRLLEANKRGTPMRVVAPVRAVLQHAIHPARLGEQTISLAVGEENDLEDLILRLSRMGYERELMVEQRGQMSVRGGIFDIFPISSELPYRLEFFGDEIESIRRFEPETQRSVNPVDSLTILPRSEKAQLRTQANERGATASLADYFTGDALVVLDEPMTIREEAVKLAAHVGESPYFMTWEALETRLEGFARVSISQVPFAGRDGVPRVQGPMRALAGWQGQNEEFWKQLQEWDREGYTVVLLCATSGERKRLFELLEEQGYRLGQDRFDVRVEMGRLRAGFAATRERLAVLSEREMFGRHYMRRTRRRFEAGTALTAFNDLKSGDYIVHEQHGIGRYLGLRRFEGKAGDFLTLQYTGGDKLYVPVTHIDMIQKYTGGDGAVPKMDKLGGATWARTRARVKKAVRDMTEELLKLYAARASRDGHAYGADTPWQGEFEEAFEYDETPDQARAIDDVKRDMESPRPMDRLICGDVGYGKTEVAMRAAFKAVMDGRQVAVLVPTTVLAEQHYINFSERFADFPIKVEMLSRFRSTKELNATIDRMKSGEVDVVVGTHRIVSKDIQFKNLGLVIIDEEQRFGVAHKERLKQLRTTVDVLTLSATPIPRTLNMSMMGVRDMSVINTAPNDRLPIHTCIEHFDEQLIQEAIQRELAREGQVFYVHNRVQTILPVAEMVRKLAPGARIAVGHGQMPERELERVMTAFMHKEVDILVCTTIIGSGLDIPNANTIIIDNASHFGLAELYQLRGRVGRYKHRAFAYLLVPGERALSEDAQKRLKALEEFSTLGSGFRIAMRDLEIRGCGNLLGGEQHGHINAVGYDTYAQLIAEAVAEVKGEPTRHRALPHFEVAADAFIPEEYVQSETQKITLYKRIAGIQATEEVDEMAAELADRFGRPPAPVKRLLEIMRVRALGADVGAKRIAAAKGAVCIELESGALLSRKNRDTLAHQFGNRLDVTWQESPSITLKLQGGHEQDPIQAAILLLRAMAEL